MDKYEFFKKQIYKLTDIDLNLYKEKQMRRRINSLANRNGFKDLEDYFYAIKKDRELFNEFINYLTINVSEFFRNPKQWEVMEHDIIPNLIKRNGKIKIWNSACSTGEEPYTLAMILTKFYNINEIKILATDIDKAAIEKAKIGIYNEKSLKNVHSEYKKKFFKKIGNSYKIDESIKKCIEFKHHNLLKDAYPKDNHLILCRNVMIYFTEEAKVKLYKNFYDSLTDDGVLFVGSTEQIILPERYNFKPIKTFFYGKAI
ncbi:CheR family methyltransferase [Caldisalinibacter kiritimatiensis]|uniref:protein-glutamate O-methyltransferase n=1 Tax=Caldisalinibacter kiritimatiensis TaxID=1304284 RepID=R1AWR7_9FIRM|nr:protein-glutamate O-methyltransferase CheR [Caldisalinibacter kiritimatiensis]EOD01638.1 Chemotaxis protein methyltransferase CheR [Caldisalinibacter kiritimatiensis]